MIDDSELTDREPNGTFYPHGPGPTRAPMISLTQLLIGAALGAAAMHFSMKRSGA
jgi:hypothetical protein